MRGWPPYEPRDDDKRNPYRPYGNPFNWDDIFDKNDKAMREMRKILSAFLSDDGSKKKMKKMIMKIRNLLLILICLTI